LNIQHRHEYADCHAEKTDPFACSEDSFASFIDACHEFLTRTLTVTDKPDFNLFSEHDGHSFKGLAVVEQSFCLSKTIFTGTRRTILVKFPVAFSDGKILNSEPLAGEKLATLPVNFSSG
jgi:hypothetical protein